MTDLQLIKIIVQRLKVLGHGSQKEIGKKLGYSNESAFSQVLNGKVNIPSDLLDRLSNLDEDVKNFIEESKTKRPRLEAKPISLHDPDGNDSTGDKIYELPDGSKVMEVPIVQAKTYAGYLRGFADPEFYEDLPTLKVSVNNYHKGTYLAFEVVGDSATPTDINLIDQAILEGWKVVGREVPKHHWQYKLHTHNYNYWVIVHKTEGILLKQIIDQNLDKGEITIHSINPKYPDEVIRLDDVEQIFNVVKREVSERN